MANGLRKRKKEKIRFPLYAISPLPSADAVDKGHKAKGKKEISCPLPLAFSPKPLAFSP
jgi:hypothetical protein